VKDQTIALNRLSCAPILAILVLICVSFSKPAYVIVPEVRNIVAYDVSSSTFLNITVYRTPEIPSHYVDMIEVPVGMNTASLIIGVQSLEPDNTFTVPYDLGPVSGIPTVMVRAHCVVKG
jgi:hypothetical protein